MDNTPLNIWIDITNSPHVNFFSQLIKDLKQAHNVIVTCRPLANTIELLDLYKIPYHTIGKHYGKNSHKKILGFIIRILSLYNYLKGKRIDIAISHSSFYSPMVSRMLGAFCVYMNDNEHAQGNRLAFMFAHKILVPEFLDISKVTRQWAKKEKIINYPGVKEGIYLWDTYRMNIDTVPSKDKDRRKTIYIRPEPWTAQYYKGKRNFIDELLVKIGSVYNVKLLPRGADQANHYRQEHFKNIHVIKKSLSLAIIIKDCDLFIGAGGTMTREAAILGIPTISIYQDELLDVDRYLISKNAMIHRIELTHEDIDTFLFETEKKTPDDFLLAKGAQAYKLMKSTIFTGI